MFPPSIAGWSSSGLALELDRKYREKSMTPCCESKSSPLTHKLQSITFKPTRIPIMTTICERRKVWEVIDVEVGTENLLRRLTSTRVVRKTQRGFPLYGQSVLASSQLAFSASTLGATKPVIFPCVFERLASLLCSTSHLALLGNTFQCFATNPRAPSSALAILSSVWDHDAERAPKRWRNAEAEDDQSRVGARNAAIVPTIPWRRACRYLRDSIAQSMLGRVLMNEIKFDDRQSNQLHWANKFH